MNKQLIGVIGIVVIVVVGLGVVLSQQQSNAPTPASVKNSEQAMDSKPKSAMEKTDDAMMQKAGSYVTYATDSYESMNDKKRVLFFHATWCPSCKAGNEDLTENASQIPADVVVFKTDYDTEKALKQKYAITSQHTFVQVDAQGNEIAKWNGGGAAELLANIK